MEQDSFNDINDEIENLELMLLDFEKNPNNQDLIHIIFRHAHNLKSYLFSFSNSKFSQIIHNIESSFDLLRKGKIDLNPELIQLSLTSLDYIKENILKNDFDEELANKLINNLEKISEEEKNKGASKKTVEIYLSEEEKNIFEKLDKNLNFYQVDKLISSDISLEDFNDLFIYQDIKEIGTHIVTIPKFDEINKEIDETILKIYFSSSLNIKEIENYIFDPFQLVEIITVNKVESKDSNLKKVNKKIKSLIIEDDFFIRRLLQIILSEYGTCDLASTGQEAINAFNYQLNENDSYDLITIDLMLDDISGHDILKSIRETEKQREIEKKSKIFIISSSEDTKNILDSYKEEAELYIKKPITKEKLVNSLFKFGLINEVQANKQIVEFPDREEFINLLDEIRLILVDMSESLFNLNERDFNEQKFEIKKNISIVRNLMSHLKLDLIVEIIDLTYNVLHKYDKLIKYNEFFLLFITDFILFLLNSLDLVKNKFSDSFLTDEKEHFYNKVLNPYFSFFETKDNNNESIELKDSLDNNLDKININSSESDTKNIKIISNIKENDLNSNISLPETKLDLKTSINKDIVSHSIKQNIKVDTDKVDQLFDLVGELITIGSTFTSYEQLKNFDDSLIRKNSKELNKIIKEIQEITISIRMIPLDELFNKMKRLVRDLSNKTNKPINFNIFGQDTEVDKNIIEELANPITHILRNAIDHGIEDENSRIQLNKPVEGNINLIAKYEGNHIAIIIEDDGKGLCIEGIYQKALEKGLVNPDKELTEQEIFKFIFEAGFSTAKEISDISGRGVGMDVVKKNIEKLNGKIFIDSIKDKGTKISLKIPLTLAILDAMLVEINNTFFAIPLEMINQSFKASSLHITDTPDGNSFVSIRSNLYKIIDLKQYFYKKISDKNKYDNSIFIIIESSEKNRVCFLVDKIIGQQQVVIKGIDETMGNLEGITGGMILGNGEIGFIIDVEKILSL